MICKRYVLSAIVRSLVKNPKSHRTDSAAIMTLRPIRKKGYNWLSSSLVEPLPISVVRDLFESSAKARVNTFIVGRSDNDGSKTVKLNFLEEN